MKNFAVLSLSLAVALAISTNASADDAKSQVKSGPQKGDALGAFYVTKVAGADEDGVETGQNLCYRCRNGSKPQVIIFTRSTDSKVAELVRKLDKATQKHEDAKLRVFVNVLGDNKDELQDKAKNFASTSKTKNVPFVVPNEFENGPDNYGINPDAEVTITLASDLGVKATHAVKDADSLDVNAVMKDLRKILN